MKKKYEKPTCRVIELQHRTMLLAGSNPDQWGYVPGRPEDEKHLS